MWHGLVAIKRIGNDLTKIKFNDKYRYKRYNGFKFFFEEI